VGAPFLARSLREKWGFSTERSQRVRPAEQRRGVDSQWQTKSRVPAGDQTGKDSTRNGIVQCRERAALLRRVKRGEKRGFRVRVTTRNSAMRWNHRCPLVAAKRRKTRSHAHPSAPVGTLFVSAGSKSHEPVHSLAKSKRGPQPDGPAPSQPTHYRTLL
jgi:hypothetical protein